MSIIHIVIRDNAKVNKTLFALVLKNVREKNISNGISDITANINKFARYFFRLFVLKNPSTMKNANKGNAILPITSKKSLISKSNPPSKIG